MENERLKNISNINLSKITNQRDNSIINSKEEVSDLDLKNKDRFNKDLKNSEKEKDNTLNLASEESFEDHEKKMKVIDEADLERLYNNHQKKIEKNYKEKLRKNDASNSSYKKHSNISYKGNNSSTNNANNPAPNIIYNDEYVQVRDDKTNVKEYKDVVNTEKQNPSKMTYKKVTNHTNHLKENNHHNANNSSNQGNVQEERTKIQVRLKLTKDKGDVEDISENKPKSNITGGNSKQLKANPSKRSLSKEKRGAADQSSSKTGGEVIDIKSFISDDVKQNYNPALTFKKTGSFGSGFTNHPEGLSNVAKVDKNKYNSDFSSPKSDLKFLKEIEGRNSFGSQEPRMWKNDRPIDTVKSVTKPSQKEINFKDKVNILINKHDLTMKEFEQTLKAKNSVYVKKPNKASMKTQTNESNRNTNKNKEKGRGSTRSRSGSQGHANHSKLNKSNGDKYFDKLPDKQIVEIIRNKRIDSIKPYLEKRKKKTYSNTDNTNNSINPGFLQKPETTEEGRLNFSKSRSKSKEPSDRNFIGGSIGTIMNSPTKKANSSFLDRVVVHNKGSPAKQFLDKCANNLYLKKPISSVIYRSRINDINVNDLLEVVEKRKELIETKKTSNSNSQNRVKTEEKNHSKNNKTLSQLLDTYRLNSYGNTNNDDKKQSKLNNKEEKVCNTMHNPVNLHNENLSYRRDNSLDERPMTLKSHSRNESQSKPLREPFYSQNSFASEPRNNISNSPYPSPNSREKINSQRDDSNFKHLDLKDGYNFNNFDDIVGEAVSSDSSRAIARNSVIITRNTRNEDFADTYAAARTKLNFVYNSTKGSIERSTSPKIVEDNLAIDERLERKRDGYFHDQRQKLNANINSPKSEENLNLNFPNTYTTYLLEKDHRKSHTILEEDNEDCNETLSHRNNNTSLDYGKGELTFQRSYGSSNAYQSFKKIEEVPSRKFIPKEHSQDAVIEHKGTQPQFSEDDRHHHKESHKLQPAQQSTEYVYKKPSKISEVSNEVKSHYSSSDIGEEDQRFMLKNDLSSIKHMITSMKTRLDDFKDSSNKDSFVRTSINHNHTEIHNTPKKNERIDKREVKDMRTSQNEQDLQRSIYKRDREDEIREEINNKITSKLADFYKNEEGYSSSSNNNFDVQGSNNNFRSSVNSRFSEKN